LKDNENKRQCMFRKGLTRHTAWIPDKFAVLGKFVKIKKDNVWEDGWEIIAIYAKMTAKECGLSSQEYKHHRKQTDI